jgi:hypothetical protein
VVVGTPGDERVIECYGCVADVNVYITVISVETLFPPLNLETSIPKFYVEMSIDEELSVFSLPINIYAMHYKAPSAYDGDLDPWGVRVYVSLVGVSLLKLVA